MLTFETDQIQGATAIVAKLTVSRPCNSRTNASGKLTHSHSLV